jgi:hypothetical protein
LTGVGVVLTAGSSDQNQNHRNLKLAAGAPRVIGTDETSIRRMIEVIGN